MFHSRVFERLCRGSGTGQVGVPRLAERNFGWIPPVPRGGRTGMTPGAGAGASLGRSETDSMSLDKREKIG